MNRNPRMPPKPPRIPPYVISWGALLHYGTALYVLGIEGFIAFTLIDTGADDWQLLLIAGAMALALFSCWHLLLSVHQSIREWERLRSDWDDINEAMNERDKGKQ